jgi:hypothetical protein
VWKVTQAVSATNIGTLGTSTGYVSMAATDVYLFIADGDALHYYTENDYARGTLTVSGAISAAETVVIGSYTYKFVTDVSPAADGSSGSPWLVLIGGNNTETLQNLYDAIANSGVAGTAYSIALVANADAVPYATTATTLLIRAANAGTGGNSTATTETMANGAWGAQRSLAAALPRSTRSRFPMATGLSRSASSSASPSASSRRGRERTGAFTGSGPVTSRLMLSTSPPPNALPIPRGTWFRLAITSWLPGWDSTEDWYPTGDGDAPFERQQGHFYDKGVWAGSVVKIKDDVMLVGTDGTVYRYGAEPQVVSTPGISQRIREHMNLLRAA